MSPETSNVSPLMFDVAAPPALIAPMEVRLQVLSAVVTASTPPLLMLMVWSKSSSAPAPRSSVKVPPALIVVTLPAKPWPSRLKSGVWMVHGAVDGQAGVAAGHVEVDARQKRGGGVEGHRAGVVDHAARTGDRGVEHHRIDVVEVDCSAGHRDAGPGQVGRRAPVPTMMPVVLMLIVPESMLQAPATSSVDPEDILIVPLKESLMATSMFSVALVNVLTTPLPPVPSKSTRASGSVAVICSVRCWRSDEPFQMP